MNFDEMVQGMKDEYSSYVPTREEYENALQMQKVYQELVEHEGWKLLMRIGEDQVNARRSDLSPFKGVEDVLVRQYMLGECNGINTMLVLPDSLREAAEFTIECWKRNEENE